MNARDTDRIERLYLDLLRAVDEAPPGSVTRLEVRKDRSGHVCRTSEVVVPRRPLVGEDEKSA